MVADLTRRETPQEENPDVDRERRRPGTRPVPPPASGRERRRRRRRRGRGRRHDPGPGAADHRHRAPRRRRRADAPLGQLPLLERAGDAVPAPGHRGDARASLRGSHELVLPGGDPRLRLRAARRPAAGDGRQHEPVHPRGAGQRLSAPLLPALAPALPPLFRAHPACGVGRPDADAALLELLGPQRALDPAGLPLARRFEQRALRRQPQPHPWRRLESAAVHQPGRSAARAPGRCERAAERLRLRQFLRHAGTGPARHDPRRRGRAGGRHERLPHRRSRPDLLAAPLQRRPPVEPLARPARQRQPRLRPVARPAVHLLRRERHAGPPLRRRGRGCPDARLRLRRRPRPGHRLPPPGLRQPDRERRHRGGDRRGGGRDHPDRRARGRRRRPHRRGGRRIGGRGPLLHRGRRRRPAPGRPAP